MNVATQRAPAKSDLADAPLSSAGIEARITDERARLATELATENDLAGQRLAPLEAGDDAGLDRIEQQMVDCRSRQARISERLEILERRLVEQQTREAEAELDAIAARANKAREMGESLIRSEFAAHASALVATLGKLRAIDDLIEQTNRTLTKADRTPIDSPNRIRCRPYRVWKEPVRKTVGIGELGHPHYGERKGRSNDGSVAYLTSGGSCPTFMEVEFMEERRDRGDTPDCLYEMTLPGIGPAAPGEHVTPLWRGEDDPVPSEVMAALVAELDGEKPARKAARA